MGSRRLFLAIRSGHQLERGAALVAGECYCFSLPMYREAIFDILLSIRRASSRLPEHRHVRMDHRSRKRRCWITVGADPECDRDFHTGM